MKKLLGTDFLIGRNRFFTTKVWYQLLAFTIPLVPRLVPLVIIFLLISRLSDQFYFKRKFNLPGGKGLIFILFYLLHVAGVLYSENTGSALFDLEVKLSLLLFPLICFGDSSLDQRNSKLIFQSFIEGCFCAVILCICHAFYQYYLVNDPSYFFYSSLSVFLHPSYLAMYLNFALWLLFYLIVERVIRFSLGYLLLVLLFVSVIILLSSKAGIVSLFISACLLLFYLINKGFRKWAALIILSLVTVVAIVYFFVPSVAERFHVVKTLFTEKQSSQFDSNVGRQQVWQSSMRVIRENYLFGTGNGDVKDALLKQYETYGYKEVLSRKLNTHNQFLQTLTGLGILGLLVFLTSLILSVFYALKERYTPYIGFLILVLFNFLFESMLETQAGTVFYAFFNAFLFYMVMEKRYLKSTS